MRKSCAYVRRSCFLSLLWITPCFRPARWIRRSSQPEALYSVRLRFASEVSWSARDLGFQITERCLLVKGRLIIFLLWLVLMWRLAEVAGQTKRTITNYNPTAGNFCSPASGRISKERAGSILSRINLKTKSLA